MIIDTHLLVVKPNLFRGSAFFLPEGLLPLERARAVRKFGVDAISVVGRGSSLSPHTEKVAVRASIQAREAFSCPNVQVCLLGEKKCLDCKADGSSFTSRSLEQILERIGKKAGIKVTPHLLRHSSGTFWIKSGGSAAILQKILGHTTQSTTQLYIHLAGSDVKEWHRRFSPGDRLKTV